jgi:hypothetical protein
MTDEPQPPSEQQRELIRKNLELLKNQPKMAPLSAFRKFKCNTQRDYKPRRLKTAIGRSYQQRERLERIEQLVTKFEPVRVTSIAPYPRSLID